MSWIRDQARQGHLGFAFVNMEQFQRFHKSRQERRLSPLNPMAGTSSPVGNSPLSGSLLTRTRTPPVRPSSSVASSPSKQQLESSLFMGSHPMLISAQSSPSKQDSNRSHSFDPSSKMRELSKPLSYKRYIYYDTTDSESDFSIYERELAQDVERDLTPVYLFKTTLSCPELRTLHRLDAEEEDWSVRERYEVLKRSEMPASPKSCNCKLLLGSILLDLISRSKYSSVFRL